MKIGVVMGGVSSEYEVSLQTGKEIMAHLDHRKHDIYPIEIKSKKELIAKVTDLDFVFLALHGNFGEDGTIQGTLDTMEIPYTGSGLTASSLCMNKELTKKLLRYEGIPTPDWAVVRNPEEFDLHKLEQLGYPLVVKPNSGGSSVGTHIVRNPQELLNAIQEASKLDSEVMVEKYIQGEEITCSLLAGELLPILSIKPKDEFFNYTSKYADGGAEETIIELNPALHHLIEQISKNCYQTLKCSVYARVDIILQKDVPYVLEVNTLPGMTKNSLFPKSAKAAGISFNRLLELLMEYSLTDSNSL